MLKIDEIDSVDICLPNFLHAPVAIDALEAGNHVYCEKPMAKTGTEAQAMYDTAQRTGKKLSVQMGTIFSRESRTAKRLIEEGALGRVYYVKTSHYRRRGRVYVDGYATPHFVQKEKSGGKNPIPPKKRQTTGRRLRPRARQMRTLDPAATDHGSETT